MVNQNTCLWTHHTICKKQSVKKENKQTKKHNHKHEILTFSLLGGFVNVILKKSKKQFIVLHMKA